METKLLVWLVAPASIALLATSCGQVLDLGDGLDAGTGGATGSGARGENLGGVCALPAM